MPLSSSVQVRRRLRILHRLRTTCSSTPTCSSMQPPIPPAPCSLLPVYAARQYSPRSPDLVVGPQADPLGDLPVLASLLGQDLLDLERLVGRLRGTRNSTRQDTRALPTIRTAQRVRQSATRHVAAPAPRRSRTSSRSVASGVCCCSSPRSPHASCAAAAAREVRCARAGSARDRARPRTRGPRTAALSGCPAQWLPLHPPQRRTAPPGAAPARAASARCRARDCATCVRRRADAKPRCDRSRCAVFVCLLHAAARCARVYTQARAACPRANTHHDGRRMTRARESSFFSTGVRGIGSWENDKNGQMRPSSGARAAGGGDGRRDGGRQRTGGAWPSLRVRWDLLAVARTPCANATPRARPYELTVHAVSCRTGGDECSRQAGVRRQAGIDCGCACARAAMGPGALARSSSALLRL